MSDELACSRYVSGVGTNQLGNVIAAAYLSGIRDFDVAGLANADALLQWVASGAEHYDLIEVMACPGGCIMGGGQPVDSYHIFQQRDGRSDGLYHTDCVVPVKNSQDNLPLQQVRDQLIRGREHQLLHRNKGKNP